ncbi:MAG: alpha/beta hydrolase fold domain-containing protein [Gemmatimonadetes bacterium]|jgi:acetyl esterase/lipase|nr:alpha/beta hydrolase fold domain-containing protein [Gemmatimonadota bacterium]MBT7864682.1 alpha/beta hydrolase fold domain-containing protein [Gemmatimonadota bacterium]
MMALPDSVSAEGRKHFEELHETPAFGAAGAFDLEELRDIMGPRREPGDSAIRCVPWQAEGLHGEWVIAPGADPDIRLLYLHGGGFVSGGSAYYLAMAGHISAAARCAVLLLDYRLAPEHPFPAAIDDCVRAYEWLRSSGPDGAGEAASIFIAGDSAGGGLTLATLLALRDRDLPLPQGAIPISAFADMTLTGESLQSEEDHDPIMSPRCLPQFVELYLADADPRDPLASPSLADYRGLPPLLIQAGEHEIIRDDSVSAAARAQEAGVDVTLEIWPGMFHVFPSHEPLLPEGRLAIEHMAAFIGQHAAREQPSNLGWRHGVLVGIATAIALMLGMAEPIPQSQEYHAFADTRSWLGIPNLFDVLSNLPFLLVGILGLRSCIHHLSRDDIRIAWITLFAGVSLVSFGSAYYHWYPTDETLVWDRLPMAVGFMGLFVALLSEYVDRRLAGVLLWPAVLLGIVSVCYWAMTDDLRPYIWVQMVALITIPVVMALFRGGFTHAWLLAVALVWYLLAKVAEGLDGQIFALAGETISGHTLKHLLAAAGCYCLYLMLDRRQPRLGHGEV